MEAPEDWPDPPPTLTANVWKKHYQVEISEDEREALETYTRQGRAYIAEAVEAVSCANGVDFCGHGSNYVFFSLAVADESEDEMQNILDMIAEQIKKVKQHRG